MKATRLNDIETLLEEQKAKLQFYLALIVIFIIVLSGSLCLIYKQMRTVLHTKNNLKQVNDELSALNEKLNEINAVKEKYVGYFMNQCALYVSKLDEYRREVIRKIKVGKIDDIYKFSSKTFEHELEDLYGNFDEAFLQLYPHFVDDFNTLLRPDARFVLPAGKLGRCLTQQTFTPYISESYATVPFVYR